MELLIKELCLTERVLYSSVDHQLALPYGPRAYLDAHSGESKSVLFERKLCYLGAVITRGLDLQEVFCDDCKKQMKDLTKGGYLDSAKNEILHYISFLRESTLLTGFLSRNLAKITLEQLTAVLEDEILIRYQESWDFLNPQQLFASFKRVPIDDQAIIHKFDVHTEEGKLRIMEYALSVQESLSLGHMDLNGFLYFNRWAELTCKLNGPHLYFDEDLVYPGDQDILSNYNLSKSHKPEQQFILRISPEPWSGNILHAKLILLTSNPGYVEHLNKSLANMFDQKSTDEILEDKRAILNMDSDCFDQYEATRILGDYYWQDILNSFGSEIYGVHKEQVFKDVAICQYWAYASQVKPTLQHVLPSQKFTKMVLFYLATSRSDVKFLILRSEKEWHGLMGEGLWNYLQSSERLLVSEHNRIQALSEKNIGKVNFAVLKKHLRKR